MTLVTATVTDSTSLGVTLLADLRKVFGPHPAMSTEDILTALNAMDDAPWGDLRGKPLDARGLSTRLRKYELAPKTVRLADGRTAKGYRRDELADVWSRYLPPLFDFAVTSVTPSQSAPLRDVVTLVTDKPDASPAELFPGTNICADCGESYDEPGLLWRCRNHHAQPSPPTPATKQVTR